MRKPGVILVCVFGVRPLKIWLRKARQRRPRDIEKSSRQVNGKELPALVVQFGDARFTAVGSVEVRPPGRRKFRPAFSPGEVIEIRDLNDNVIATP